MSVRNYHYHTLRRRRSEVEKLDALPYIPTRISHLVIVCFFQPYYTGHARQQATQCLLLLLHCVACSTACPV